jgi:hypothetical protein
VLVVIIGAGVLFATILLPQQQASAIITTFAKSNKCNSGDDIITCTHDKKTYHSTKDDSTPFHLPLPFP